MTENPFWLTLLTSILLPLLTTGLAYYALVQAGKKNRLEQRAQDRRDLSQEAIDLYDRTIIQVRELEDEVSSNKKEAKELTAIYENLKVEVAELSKALDDAITCGWILHDQLLANKISPVLKPMSRRNIERK